MPRRAAVVTAQQKHGIGGEAEGRVKAVELMKRRRGCPPTMVVVADTCPPLKAWVDAGAAIESLPELLEQRRNLCVRSAGVWVYRVL
uniref:Uncharacterized protein n=1 Tax=Trichuris muris TaxID=70415 RepID=A0A5S6QE57_TRIMR